jgi:uncharacterized BrkB/YihY/UPF0761 family membrane protein
MSAPSSSDSGATSVPQLILELRELVVAYFRQEAIDPIKSLGRYVVFGLVGALLLGLGVVLLGVGALRTLQAETGSTFRGDWSWAPYGIVFVALLVGGALTWKARGWRRARA